MPAVIESRVCIHCGTTFRPTALRPDFCCAGCQFVHDLIRKNGLGQFYDLQDGGLPPVASLVFQKRDYSWLEEMGQKANGFLSLDVQGLSCLGCAWLIERLYLRRAGAQAIRVDPARGQLVLHFQPEIFDLLAFARELQSFGYLVGPLGAEIPANRALSLRLGLCAALAMNVMLFTLPRYFGMENDFQFAPLFSRLSLILGTLSVLIGGSYFFLRSWRNLRAGVLSLDLPISLGLIAAYTGSVVAWKQGAEGFVYFDFVATFTFLMLVGRWLQEKAVESNRRRLLSAQAAPPTVRDAATGQKMDPLAIQEGTNISVSPGQTVPVRARLQSSTAILDLQWISGEAEAATALRGRIVPAGAVNCGEEAIVLVALEPWSESLLARLLHIDPAPGPRKSLHDRFIRAYTVTALTLACLGFAGWWVATGALLPALQVFISVLVVSCPCASGVALPLANDLATARLRRLGIFIRDTELWNRLEQVTQIIFDKTGTLTLEILSLRNPEALHQLTPHARDILLTIVHDSSHPVSGCLREQLLAGGACLLPGLAPQETIGFGLEFETDGSIWRLGRPAWTGANSPGECAFTRDGRILAGFRFGEALRADAVSEVQALETSGLRVFILSGDRDEKVRHMARQLGLPPVRCYGEMSPEDKARWVERFDAHDTLYLGDGANDSLAFDAAWCSGTPAVDRGLLEQKADFYFLGRGLAGVRTLLQTAATRRRVARAVVTFAIAYNGIAIALCLAGRMNPLLAAILMPSSSLVSLGLVFWGLSRAPFRRRPTVI